LLQKNSTLLYQCFTVLEFNLFGAFLYTQINTKAIRKAIVISGIIFALFSFIFPYFQEENIDSVPIGVETIIILIFSFYYLYEQMNDTSTLFIYSTYPFWMVIGVVLFLSGSFFTYIFADSLPPNEVNKYWVITNVFSIVRSLFFCIGIVVSSKPPRTLPPSDFEFSSLN
jgi:hypothetical protein